MGTGHTERGLCGIDWILVGFHVFFKLCASAAADKWHKQSVILDDDDVPGVKVVMVNAGLVDRIKKRRLLFEGCAAAPVSQCEEVVELEPIRNKQ